MSRREVVDVAVVGAGTMGSSTAYQIAKSGKSVALLEQFEFGHVKGSSHGDGRIYRVSYPEAHLVRMMQRALKLWDELESDTGDKVYQETGMIDVGVGDVEYFYKLLKTYKELSISHEILTPEQCNKRFPQFSLPQNCRIVYVQEAGAVFADKAVAAFQKAARKYGAKLMENSKIIDISQTVSGSFLLRLENGSVLESKKLVLTCGSWTNKVLEMANMSTLPLNITHEQVTYFKPKPGCKIDFSPKSMPVYAINGESVGEYFIYGIPKLDHGEDGVKLSVHLAGTPMDPDNRPPNVVDQKMLNIAEKVRGWMLPNLEPDGYSFVRCIYTTPSDGKFVMGTHPQNENVVVGTGFSGEGFKFSSIVGEILKDFSNGDKPVVDVSMFAVDRFNKAKL